MKTFKKVFFAASIFMILSATIALAAEKMQQSRVEYSADTYFETEQLSFNGRIYHALGGKDRQEMNVGGSNQITIVRMDKQLAWVLMPESQMYMETDLKTGKRDSRDVNDCSIDQKISGNETVNGINATRSKISMSCPDGIQYAGDMWVTKDGILVKMDATGKTKDSKVVRIKTELKNLKIATQNPALFEIPAGYTQMSMGGLMGAFGFGNENKVTGKDTKQQSGRDYTSQQRNGRDYTSQERNGGRDYTSQQRNGRDYTSQQRTGRDYTSQQRGNVVEKVDETFRKVRGIFGF
jgi:hypothetical protein